MAKSNDSVLATAALVSSSTRPATGGETAAELIIDADQVPRRLHRTTCSARESDALRALPAARSPPRAFAEETGHPAWKDLPSWAAVGTADKADRAPTW